MNTKRLSYEEICNMLGEGNLPVHVTYSEKDELKRYHIKWHPVLKFWFVNKEFTYYPKIKARLSKFDPSGVRPELVPASNWEFNLRSILKQEDWKQISSDVRSHGICMNCGGRGSAIKKDAGHALEAHEEWSYDDKNHIQTLERIVALCPDCHLVRHIGYASTIGVADAVKIHMMAVRNIDKNEARRIISDAFAEFDERSKYEWTLNLDNLSKYTNSDKNCHTM